MLTHVLRLASLTACVVVTGCATTVAESPSTASTSAPVVQERAGEGAASYAQLQRELEDREARVRTLEAQLSAASASPSSGPGNVDTGLFPPDATPGQCWARVLVPARYRNWEEQVLVREASERVEGIPARFEMVEERVLVREAETRLEVVPATFESVTERVMVKPATTRIEEVPATYSTVTERVLDKPAHTVWKKGPPSLFGDAVVSSRVEGTGEVMCLVEVPATYRTFTRTVVDKPAHIREIEVPAEYETVTRQVVKTPATTREITVPAEYRTVKVRKLIAPASERRIPIPAEYHTVAKSEKVADEVMSWQQVLCEVNATAANVRALQEALGKQGYEVRTDGVLGRETLTAVNRFAAARNIPHGDNFVPIEVLKALNVRI